MCKISNLTSIYVEARKITTCEKTGISIYGVINFSEKPALVVIQFNGKSKTKEDSFIVDSLDIHELLISENDFSELTITKFTEQGEVAA